MLRKYQKAFSVALLFLLSVSFLPQSAAASEPVEKEVSGSEQIHEADDQPEEEDSVLTDTTEAETEEPLEIEEEKEEGEVDVFFEEEVEPSLISVGIFSDNEKSEEWAKIGDSVFVSFETDEELNLEETEVLIGGRLAGVEEVAGLSENKYLAVRIMDGDDEEGEVFFVIKYGEEELEYDQKEIEGGVVFDKTPPKIYKSLDDYLGGTETLSAESSLESFELFVEENNRVVEIATEWKLVSRKPSPTVSYSVTFFAEDQAGNKAVLKNHPVDLKKEKAATVFGDLEVELIGPEVLKNLERGEDYRDAGARVDWSEEKDCDHKDLIGLWIYGDLNLSRTGKYSLGYAASCRFENSNGEKVGSAERKITVVDTIAPQAVKNLKALSGDGYVRLSWQNPTDEDFYGVNVYRSQVREERGEIIFAALRTTSVEDQSVENDEVYYYTLEAFDYDGNGRYSEQIAAYPKGPKIVSRHFVAYAPTVLEEVPEEVDEEVISGEIEEEEEDEPEERTTQLPTAGIVILVLLLALGAYLLYLQDPGIFEKLKFWERRKPTKRKPRKRK